MVLHGTLSSLRGRRTWRLLAAAVLAALLANAAPVVSTLGMPGLAWLSNLEFGVFQKHLARRPIPTNGHIVVVAIESETPQKLGMGRPVLPLPRDLHARLIRLLRKAEARSLVLDLRFDRPSVPAEDLELEAALQASAPLQVTLATQPDWFLRDPAAPTGWRYHFPRPVVLPDPPPPNVRAASARPWDPDHTPRGAILVRPTEPAQGGATPALVQTLDARAGRGEPISAQESSGSRGDENEIYHLALSALLGASLTRPRWDQATHRVEAGPYAWAVGEDGELPVRWAREGFERIEYADALAELRTRPGRRFRDAIVLVGDYSGQDIHRTDRGEMHGVDFVAHMINTLLDRSSQLVRWSIPANLAWSLFLALVTAASLGSLDRRLTLVGLAGAAGAAVAVPVLALSLPVWVDTVGPLTAVLLTLTFGGIHASRLAARFTPAHLRHGRPTTLTDTATVMFVDLQGSTRMAERLGPERAQAIQAELLEIFSSAVAQAGGEVERTLGDGLMAVFHRSRGEEHALRCLHCVPHLLDAAARMSVRWSQEMGTRVGITIGVESGVVSGTVIHTGDREEWSSFGPTVNLAARLQGACSELGTAVLLGPGAWARARHAASTVALGSVSLKGFDGEIPVYSVAVPACAAVDPPL